ncbi:hypothetical protein BaRGS_00010433 [Batillaria attramentaria]|uniref:Uncharacterized protein n=1 Tax=Batillaria attramentaria TaxID=370345 RepID=A0ABD0LFH6_9CAEN
MQRKVSLRMTSREVTLEEFQLTSGLCGSSDVFHFYTVSNIICERDSKMTLLNVVDSSYFNKISASTRGTRQINHGGPPKSLSKIRLCFHFQLMT